MIESLDAVTLVTGDMARSVAFYGALGFELDYGGPGAAFTSFRAGRGHLNLMAGKPESGFSGRVIFHVADVDAFWRKARDEGLAPEAPPRDASWGERFFHLTDPDGHALAFARPIPGAQRLR